MIILDSNVLSEIMRGPDADPRVISWLRATTHPMVTTVFNRAEILAGLALLPEGARRNALTRAAVTALSRIEACLPFTEECTVAYAELVAQRRRSGLPISTMASLVAAVARTFGAAVATRNVKDFTGLGLGIVDPWAATR